MELPLAGRSFSTDSRGPALEMPRPEAGGYKEVQRQERCPHGQPSAVQVSDSESDKGDAELWNTKAITRRAHNWYPSEIPCGRGSVWITRKDEIESRFLRTLTPGNFLVIDCTDGEDPHEKAEVEAEGGEYWWYHFAYYRDRVKGWHECLERVQQ